MSGALHPHRIYHADNLLWDAAVILDEYRFKAASSGWSGDITHVAVLEHLLAPWNIGYTDDMHGTWSHVEGGSFVHRSNRTPPPPPVGGS